jgi:hypothetical protein
MKTYATIDDVRQLWREMTTEETNKAGYLLEVVSASLRSEAKKVGKRPRCAARSRRRSADCSEICDGGCGREDADDFDE